MEDEEKVDPDYLKGFNEGYTIAQYMPELAQKLAAIDNDQVRLAGFQDGRKQYQLEQTKDRLPSWLKGDRASKNPNPPTKAKDRDIEPDKD
ncbi:hypothetical protein IC229_28795 [Spirosoma sp. BT702]|uniref:Uncharacterized protein n=1 Tax=Spirosoma profusum TaxID=2771354 RepID=A0A927API3_9BACT|nr:hypothetical protein [Spirosoma profusum]MBD2704669.1 hypothetical protein [Spirosoma profusum]